MDAKNINTQEFEKLMAEGRPVLVEFWAPWCVYCRRIEGVYDKIAEEYTGRAEIVKVNIDEEAILSHQEQIEVIPTLVAYRDGKAMGSIVAPQSKAEIEDFLTKYL